MQLSDLSGTQIDDFLLLGIVRDVDDQGTAAGAQIVERATNDLGWPVGAIRDRLRELANSGYLTLDERLAGMIAGARMLSAGWGALQEFESERSSLPKRRQRLRDVYLTWLYTELEEKDGSPTPDAFLATAPMYYGLPYTTQDLEKVGEWLRDNGFIRGEGAWQYAGPLRPTLTEKGRFTVESGRSANDPAPTVASTTFSTIVHGSANVNNGGNDVQQIMNVEWVPAGTRLLDTIEQALPAIESSIADLVIVQLGEARVALAEPADVGKLRKALGVLGGFLGATAAGTLGNMLSDQITNFLAGLPG